MDEVSDRGEDTIDTASNICLNEKMRSIFLASNETNSLRRAALRSTLAKRQSFVMLTDQRCKIELFDCVADAIQEANVV